VLDSYVGCTLEIITSTNTAQNLICETSIGANYVLFRVISGFWFLVIVGIHFVGKIILLFFYLHNYNTITKQLG
jgi:hypothetical protein